ncbi:MAG: sigma-70 family RNA polymerase sigma factor [Deltaproteobacteria bacterium]|nr:sigma-70 family RNA polymerase sigma factor [Deltaproteobacteria bacterium]
MATPQPAPAPKVKDDSEDIALVARAKAKDAAAFEQLVKKHHQQVYRLALTMTKNPRDAEEVTQETFLNIHRKLDSFRGESKFSSWLYRVTANFALMRLRKQRRQPQVLLDDLLPQYYENGQAARPASDWSERADRQLENKELGSKINEAIGQLPEKYRIILVLRDVENLANDEIAETLGMSVPAVKSILHRSRLFVREALNKYFEGHS